MADIAPNAQGPPHVMIHTKCVGDSLLCIRRQARLCVRYVCVRSRSGLPCAHSLCAGVAEAHTQLDVLRQGIAHTHTHTHTQNKDASPLDRCDSESTETAELTCEKRRQESLASCRAAAATVLQTACVCVCMCVLLAKSPTLGMIVTRLAWMAHI